MDTMPKNARLYYYVSYKSAVVTTYTHRIEDCGFLGTGGNGMAGVII